MESGVAVSLETAVGRTEESSGEIGRLPQFSEEKYTMLHDMIVKSLL